MASNRCVASLTKISTETLHSAQGVSYRSQGSLLIVCDAPFDLAPLHEVGVPGPTVLVWEGPAAPAARPGDSEIRCVQGRVTALSGWLGEFSFELASVSRGAAQGSGPGGARTFDLVIDLSASPLIERSVPPLGYFAPRTPAGLASALEQCKDLVGRFAKPKYFHYELGLCAHASFGQPGCTRCLDVCAADAIRSEGDRISVEPHLCQGCAACTLACPTGALSFTGPTRDTLLEQVERAIASAGVPNPTLVIHPPGVAVPALAPDDCVDLAVEPLAAFGEEIWFAALARGAGRIVLLADDSVPEETRRLLQARLEIARTVLDACGQAPDAVSLAERLEDVRVLAGGRRVTERPAADPVDLSSPLPTHHKRALLTRSLARLEPAEEFEPRALDDGSPLGAIVVDEQRCTLCSACVKICPTAALRYTTTDEPGSGSAWLAFAEEVCVQCGACERGCPEDAISLQPRIAALADRGFWRVLSSGPLASCADCGNGFMPRKLLDASIRRTEAAGMPPAAVEQMQRCPDCRHRRLNRS